MDDYLFVDGGWLRELLDGISKRYFNGVPLEMDYHSLFKDYLKTFYFDCDPVLRKNELTEDHEARVRAAKETFNKVRRLPGCHVFLGHIRGEGQRQRQKGVGTQLSVQAMVHVFRHNTRRLTIMTGDPDFKPLIDALVLEGAYVTLASDLRQTSRDLIDAADAHRLLWPGEIFRFTTRAFKAGRNFPEGTSTRLLDHGETWPDLGANWGPIWDGTCSTGRVTVIEETGGDCALLCRSRDRDEFLEIHCRDAEVLKNMGEDL
jgi:uncharacterized LabA/DUF88 family protein